MTGEYRVIGHRAATVSEQAGRERPGSMAALIRAERAEAWAEGWAAACAESPEPYVNPYVEPDERPTR